MIVYHGTSCHAAESILETESRCPLSTSTDLEIGKLFALRRSPPSLLSGDETEAGRVIEFEVCGTDWEHFVAPGVLQDEKEIKVHKASSLRVVALWALKDGNYQREETCPTKLSAK